MPSIYYRGDNRAIGVIQKNGFQPQIESCRGRTSVQAIAYIQKIIKDNNFKSLADIGAYIISNSKGDSVSTSCVLDGASYGTYKYQITAPENALYFEFNLDGSVGAQQANQGNMYGRKPYYILTNVNLALSLYVIVGTRTATQEATFFTDIPSSWVTLLS
ncbi:hypothetical protein BV924_17200 [Pectobacterium odoriferum]|uniref:Uncharacterized protein n=1 Tax=Pectobacterium odoriferum TaxID=78398 RepID=A0ABD6VNM3_9GAMM|nr:hypothetical protein [Pectobacterium odoriferum]POD93639.1 hypothetical protein BVY06_17565 [Pectobacterium odoriferum]POE10439.1 hypothetical protein BV924_17200 [Pectobacterium odoriferum]POE25302.1 hypothetical protein BV926_17260 [Pectobacterium odoriferum]POE29663.1 hypothetical protein BV919_17280 [Pectobacterium odoriferum]POE38213.1 hypothetical protein BV920_17160 [Pectobacterium odoriferum]